MFGLETIRAMNAESGMKARAKKLKPFELNSEEQIDEMPPFPFPNFGDKADDMDEQYDRVDSLFVDSSGFGAPHEPALNADQLLTKIRELFEEHGTLLFAIESQGQFQLHVGVWKEKDTKGLEK